MRKLSKKWCKVLSTTIKSKDLGDMLERAKNEVPDWSVPSRSNKGMSRGKHWNMFCKDFGREILYAPIIRYRLLEEYGEYLDDSLKPISSKIERPEIKTYHEEPDFTKFNK